MLLVFVWFLRILSVWFGGYYSADAKTGQTNISKMYEFY